MAKAPKLDFSAIPAGINVPAVLDVEASGFGAGGFPIEVGFALEDGSSHCALIRPALSWTHWDPAAESIHGISHDVLLRLGRDVSEVARELNTLLRDRVVYSDGWGNDFTWLGLLFAEARVLPRFRVESLRTLLSDEEASRWHGVKDAVEGEMAFTRHRASGDAQVLQRTLLRVKGMNTGGKGSARSRVIRDDLNSE
ncbi:MAG: hypothetical protein ABI612_09780 [Betaproteobacteria bacterium]